MGVIHSDIFIHITEGETYSFSYKWGGYPAYGVLSAYDELPDYKNTVSYDDLLFWRTPLYEVYPYAFPNGIDLKIQTIKDDINEADEIFHFRIETGASWSGPHYEIDYHVVVEDGFKKLFTNTVDYVDFNNLSARQEGSLDIPQHYVSPYDAKSGNDIVYLPDFLNRNITSKVTWDYSKSFRAGDGDDFIAGGNGDDIIYGDNNNDRIVGSHGKDKLYGGAGRDIFHFESDVLNQITGGTVQKIDGGSNPATTTNRKNGDEISLGGSADDYGFEVSGTATKISILKGNTSGFSSLTLDTINVERATFEHAVDNQVTLTSSAGSLLVEMAKLANAAYDDGGPSIDKAWHAISALELGMVPAGKSLLWSWTFAEGHFRADSPLAGNADALVVIGVVDGKRTLSVSFAGTDEFEDLLDYLPFENHFANFAPLMKALREFTNDVANGVEQVLVSGHSLGAAMVQWAVAQGFPGLSSKDVKAVTFGSPGAEIDTSKQLLNVAHTQDPVFHGPGVVGYQHAGGDLLADSFRFTAISNSHGLTNYIKTAENLAILAQDKQSPFWSYSVAYAIRELSAYTGSTRVDPGSADNDTLTADYADDIVVAGGGDDTIKLVTKAAPNRVIDGGLGGEDKLVITDGFKRDYSKAVGSSSGATAILYKGMETAEIYRIEKIVFAHWFGPDTELMQVRANSARATAANPWAAGPVVYLDGRAATVQKATPGQLKLGVSGTVDYVDAGNGDREVIGSTTDDVIVYGSGVKLIQGRAGADIFLASGTLTTSTRVTISGGQGVDIIVGAGVLTAADYADKTQSVVVSLAGDKDVYAYVNGAIEDTLRNVANINGGSANDTLSGDTLRNVLSGNAGNDVLNGRGGGDVLIGGAGLDTASYAGALSGVTASLIGSSANTNDAKGDTYSSIENLTGSSFNDKLTGNAITNILNGGVGNDILNGDAGNDVLIGGVGADQLLGGAGTDTASYEGSARRVTASLAAAAANTNDAKGDSFASIENLTGSSYADYLLGNTAANQLSGGAGNDRLIGGAGDDKLIGGRGKDALVGGSGKDIFVFKAMSDSTPDSSGQDTIFDFSITDDRIDLSEIDASLKVGGNQAFSFIGSAAFTGKAAELRYGKSASDTFVYGDVNGDKVADFTIHFDDALVMQKGSFIL